MRYLDTTVEVLANSMILALVAAIVRVMFTKSQSYQGTVSIFLGSILFGVMMGYILNDFDFLKKYLKVIIVVFSVFGKELFIWCERFMRNPRENIGLIVMVVNIIRSIEVGISSATKAEKEKESKKK